MIRSILFTVALALLVTGCVKLKGEPLNRKNYVLEVRRDGPERNDSGKMIRVLRLGIAQAYGGKELVYRLPGGEVQSDYYHEYFSSPEVLLSQELTRWLRDSGLATLVMAESVALSDAVLEGSVTELYGDFTGDTPQAVVEMQFFLVSEKGSSEVLYHKTFRETEPVATQTPEALVSAINRASARIFASLEDGLAEVL